MKWYLLRWLVCWAELVDGLLGVLTFGTWPWYLSPLAENLFLDYSDRQFFLKPPRKRRPKMRLATTITVAITFLAAGTARADFILTGDEHREVTAVHSLGVLRGSSTADVNPGAYIVEVHLKDDSTLRMFGGYIESLYTDDASTVVMSGGEILMWLVTHDDSRAEVAGGTILTVNTRDASNVVVSGGEIVDRLRLYEDSAAEIIGGTVNSVSSQDGSTVVVSGGELNYLNTYSISTAEVTGGSVGHLDSNHISSVTFSGGRLGTMFIDGISTVTFHGHQFQPSNGLGLNEGIVSGEGRLAGRWADWTPWTADILRMEPGATVLTTPEPGGLRMLIAASVTFVLVFLMTIWFKKG